MSIEYLKKEDYEEPACPFCTDGYGDVPQIKSIPVSRIISKLDEHLSRNDYASAERHLYYWLEEAKAGRDKRGELSIYNELLGLMRKTNQKEKAFSAVDNVLTLIKELDFNGTVTAGTAYVNLATVLKSFNENEKAIPYYRMAEKIYLEKLNENDDRIGGLYNNMALAVADCGNFDEAELYYHKAVDIMKKAENGELEIAITYLNMANLCEKRDGLEIAEMQISNYIEKAYSLIDTPSLPRNGYYAFVCEKCAPTFGYYGYFLYENELKKRAERIYERA